MLLFDCHNHIQDERLLPDLENVMQRARSAGVCRMAIKGCSEEDWTKVVGIVNRYPDAGMAFGLHPWFTGGRSAHWLHRLRELLTGYPQASVGEIGIDHAVGNRDDADQERVFLAQLELAAELGRPVTIHCRRAWGRLLELLDGIDQCPSGMLIHCFGGSAEIAQELVRRGAFISFSGSITRPNNRKAGPAIRAVPDDRMLIETDAPDILPQGAAGPLNEPAHLRLVLAKAAELRGVSGQELARITFENAERFFDRTGSWGSSRTAAGETDQG